ncbi:MAG: 2-oxoglutarate dehydrogenase complex dihydrolipoyllysine-residue succinyltransferase [Phycisphaeraceae bacterium]
MPLELKVPEVGESITEVAIGRWLKSEGEQVRKDDPIVEIETDKVTLELPAPADGTITKIIKPQGEQAVVGETIGEMEAGEVAAVSAADSSSKASADGDTQPATLSETPARQSKESSVAVREGDGSPRIMPAAQRLIEQNRLNPAEIPATGPGGRILKEDVQAYMEQRASSQPADSSKPAADSAPGRREQVVPMTPMRKRIAERLVQAQQTAALLTTFNEIDMTAVMDLRNKYKDAFLKKYNIKLGFMSFFTRAVIDALMQFPAINAEIRGTDIIYKDYYDIGIAIGTGKGLVVPILRNAERMSFAEIEKAIADYTEKVKSNQLAIEDLQGGTFTITNGGVFGSLMSTPIVNPPQSAVLGMHAIKRRPVAVGEGADERIEIRPMMYVALTYDHRLVDGREAVSFLVRIKQALEDPARMLMEI